MCPFGQVARGCALGLLAMAAAVATFSLTACGGIVAAKGASTTGPRAATTSVGSSLCANAKNVDLLMIERVNSFPQNHEHFTFPAEVTVGNPAKVRALAEAICALPPIPRGVIACPADWGIIYRLSFTVNGRKLPAVTVDATGCQGVDGLGRTLWAERSPAFWNVLGTAMDISHVDNSTFRGTIG